MLDKINAQIRIAQLRRECQALRASLTPKRISFNHTPGKTVANVHFFWDTGLIMSFTDGSYCSVETDGAKMTDWYCTFEDLLDAKVVPRIKAQPLINKIKEITRLEMSLLTKKPEVDLDKRIEKCIKKLLG